jgi:hypothetical protein
MKAFLMTLISLCVSFLSHFSYFEKVNVGLRDHHAVYPPINF